MSAVAKDTNNGNLPRVSRYQTRSHKSVGAQPARQDIWEYPNSPQTVKANTHKKRGRPPAKRTSEALEEESSAAPKRSPGRPRKAARLPESQHVSTREEDDVMSAEEATTPARNRRTAQPTSSGQDADETRDPSEEDEDEVEGATFDVWADDIASNRIDNIDLLGHGHHWNTIIDAFEELRELAQENQFTLKTHEAEKLCEYIDLLMNYYGEDSQTNAADPTDRNYQTFKRRVELLSNVVQQLNLQTGDPRQIGNLLLDMYTHVVPFFVVFIDVAIKTQAPEWQDEPDISQLEEIIAHLKIFIILTRKITAQTRIKPATQQPIRKPVKQKIFPHCRILEQRLSNELKRYKIAQIYSQERLDRQREEWLRVQEAKQAALKEKIMRKRQATAEAVARLSTQRTRSIFDPPTPPRLVPMRSSPKEIPTKPSTLEWTEEEDDELTKQLAYHSELPNDQRYDRCVHCRLLQNKSAELVRERALEFKPALELFYTEHKGVEVPAWVTSID